MENYWIPYNGGGRGEFQRHLAQIIASKFAQLQLTAYDMCTVQIIKTSEDETVNL